MNQTNYPAILKEVYWNYISLTLFITVVLLGGGIFLYFVSKAPALSESKLVATTSSKIFDSKNELIADLGSERRVKCPRPMKFLLTWSRLSYRLKTTVSSIIEVSIPFELWVRHYETSKEGGLQGGSTLTQQLIKVDLFLTSTSDQTFVT